MLSNISAIVSLERPGRLVCDTRSPWIVGLLWLGAGVAGLGSVAAGVAALASGAPVGALGGVAMGLAGGVALGWIARRRSRMNGRFVIDADARTVGAWSFDEVAALSIVADPTDGMRPDLFPGLPSWLVVTRRGGERIRVAKGSRAELAPVVALLCEWGLPAPS